MENMEFGLAIYDWCLRSLYNIPGVLVILGIRILSLIGHYCLWVMDLELLSSVMRRKY